MVGGKTPAHRPFMLLAIIAIASLAIVSIQSENVKAASQQGSIEISVEEIPKKLIDIWLNLHGLEIADLKWAWEQVKDEFTLLNPPSFGLNRPTLCRMFGGFVARVTGNYASEIFIPDFGTDLATGFIEYAIEKYPGFDNVQKTQATIKKAAVTIERKNHIFKDVCVATAKQTPVLLDGLRGTAHRLFVDRVREGDGEIDSLENDIAPLKASLREIYSRTGPEFNSAANKFSNILQQGLKASKESQNRSPNAQNDHITIIQGQRQTIDVLDNDSDPDQDSLTINSLTSPDRGSASIKNGKRIVFDASSVSTGSTRLTYGVIDGKGGSDTATVRVRIVADQKPDGEGPTTQQGIDLVAAIDVSGSVCRANNLSLEIDGFFNAVKNVIVPFVKRGGGPVQLAVISFSDTARTRLQLTNVSGNMSSIRNALNRVKQSAQCGDTNMTAALNNAATILEKGRAQRSVVNLVTDGKPDNKQSAANAAMRLKNAGYELWTLGIGSQADNTFLQSIAGPANAHNTAIQSFEDLEQAETEKLGEIVGPDLLASFEDLLKQQSKLISSFTDLLETQPLPKVSQLERLEALLKRQSDRLASFSSTLLSRMDDMSGQRTGEFLFSLEKLLKSQAELLMRFAGLISSKKEYPQHIVSSLEKMIKTQSDLLTEFEKDVKQATGSISLTIRNKLIKSFDELIRLQDELLRKFSTLNDNNASSSSDTPSAGSDAKDAGTTVTATLMSMTIANLDTILSEVLPSSGPLTITFRTPNGPIQATLAKNNHGYSLWQHRLYLSPGEMTVDFQRLRVEVTSVTVQASTWGEAGKTEIRALDKNGNVIAKTSNNKSVVQESLSITSKQPISQLVIDGESSYIGEISINNSSNDSVKEN